MREPAFRIFLTPRLSPRSIDSYVSDAGRVERELALNLDDVSLDEASLAGIRDTLVRSGVPAKSAGNCLSALRSYAAMRSAGR